MKIDFAAECKTAVVRDFIDTKFSQSWVGKGVTESLATTLTQPYTHRILIRGIC